MVIFATARLSCFELAILTYLLKFLISCNIACLVLPLHAASVDAMVTDVPFGAKHGTVDDVRHLLPQLLPSCHRFVDGASSV